MKCRTVNHIEIEDIFRPSVVPLQIFRPFVHSMKYRIQPSVFRQNVVHRTFPAFNGALWSGNPCAIRQSQFTSYVSLFLSWTVFCFSKNTILKFGHIAVSLLCKNKKKILRTSLLPYHAYGFFSYSKTISPFGQDFWLARLFSKKKKSSYCDHWVVVVGGGVQKL